MLLTRGKHVVSFELKENTHVTGSVLKCKCWISNVRNYRFLFFYLDHLFLHLELHSLSFAMWGGCRLHWLAQSWSIWHSHSAIYPMPRKYWNYLQTSTNFQVLKRLARFDIVSDTCHLRPCYLNSNKKYFYFWAIDIVIPSGDSSLGPKAFSLIESEIAP